METPERSPRKIPLNRGLYVSVCSAWPSVSWEQRVQGMNPREIKYSKELILGKFVDTINHGTFRKLILNDVIKIAHERSANVT